MRSEFTSVSIATVILFLAGGATHAQSIRQTAEMVDFVTGAEVRGGGVLTRTATEVRGRLSALDLDKKAAYSVWWVVFNDPENCLTQFQCGESDIFSAPGVLNAAQIVAARISVFYADGFVTGTDGTGNVTAHLDSGSLPTGTFVNFGWSEPVGPGPDPNSGLVADNGLHAEMHLVVRTHGKAVAGSVGEQTSTFTALCDIQDCADQLALIFPSPDAP